MINSIKLFINFFTLDKIFLIDEIYIGFFTDLERTYDTIVIIVTRKGKKQFLVTML